jgi:transposase
MEAVESEPLFAERVAGVDIGKAEVVAAVRVPGNNGRRMQEVRSFPATRRGLEELADWMDSHGVTRVGMESTGDWKPVFFTLERRGFECLLYNSRQVKAQPGRPKTDPLTGLRSIAAGQSVARRSACPLSRCPVA